MVFDSSLEQRYNTLHVAFDTIEPAFIMNREGTILDANKAFAAAFGKQVEECLQTNAFDLLPPEVAAKRKIKIAEALSTSKMVMYEDERYGRCIRLSISPIADNDGNMTKLYIVAQDITDLRLAEKNSKSQETFSKALIEAIPGAFYMVDSEGQYAVWNTFQRDVVVGKPDSEMINTYAIDTIHPDDKALVAEKMTNIMQHGSEESEEVKILIHGGPEFRWFRISGKKIIFNGDPFILGIGSDITERKKAEEKAFKSSENQLQKLSAAIEQSPAVVIITDPMGDIEYVNPMFTQLTGYSAEEVHGKNSRILQSGLMPKTLYEDLWHTILSGGIWRGEIQNKKKNGELFWEAAVISAILNEGVVKNFVAVKEDITEQKQYLNELIAAKERAEESDRLKSAFLANISHEIRTPMNGILGFSELLKEPRLSGEKQTVYIDLIQQSGQRMLNLINDLIDISRIEAGEAILQISETQVNKLIEDLHVFFKPAADKKGLRLRCSTGLTDEEGIIQTDSSKLNQILTNLVQNALKFTHSGDIDFGYSRKDSMLEFYVIDSGIGIPVNMKEKIFERFRQVDNSLTRHHEGSGLGLSISKAYVTMLGGTIRVESVETRGSAFLVTLPYNPPGLTNVEPDSPVTEEYSASAPDLTILIADDDMVSGLVLKMFLKSKNITILSAVNGKEAVELVEKHPEIHLVLMDIKMPVMNGLEATRRIKKLRPELPVISQTAFTSNEDMEKAIKAGCDRVILKPINKNELLELISELLYH